MSNNPPRRNQRLHRAFCEALERRTLLSSPIINDPIPRDQRADYIAPGPASPNLSSVPPGHFEWEYGEPKLVYRLDQPVVGLDNQTHALMALYQSVLVENTPYPLEDVPVTLWLGDTYDYHSLTLDSADNGQTWSGNDGDVSVLLYTDAAWPGYHLLRATTSTGTRTWRFTWNGHNTIGFRYTLSGSMTGDGANYGLDALGSQQYSTSHTAGNLVLPPDISAPVFSADGKTVTFTFANEYLADGNYEAILNSAGITNLSGTEYLDGNITLAGEQDFVYSFFVRAGDANHDRVVNIDDFGVIDGNRYNGSTGFFNGDFDYDGVINDADYDIINRTYGTVLPLPPTTPGQPTIGATGNSITLTWIQPEGTTGTGIWRSDDFGVTFDFLTLVQGATTWTDSDLPDGAKYVYRTRAWSETAGYSHTTEKVWAVTNLPGPVKVRATNSTGETVTLNWTDNANGEDYYQVFMSVNGGAFEPLDTVAAQSGSGGAMSYTVGGMNRLDNIVFRVEARTAATESMPAEWGNTATTGGTTILDYRGTNLPDADYFSPSPIITDGNGNVDLRRMQNSALSATIDGLPRHVTLYTGPNFAAINLWDGSDPSKPRSDKTITVKVDGQAVYTLHYKWEQDEWGNWNLTYPEDYDRSQIVLAQHSGGWYDIQRIAHNNPSVTISIEGTGFQGDPQNGGEFWALYSLSAQVLIPWMIAAPVGSSVIEGGTGVAHFSLGRNLDWPVTPHLAFTGTAQSALDYLPIADAPDWPDTRNGGPGALWLPFQAIDDNVVEMRESATMILLPGDGYARDVDLYPGSDYDRATLYIDDNEPMFSIEPVGTIYEDGGPSQGGFYFNRDTAAQAMDVTYQVSGTAGSDDYQSLSGQVHFDANQYSVFLPLIPTPGTVPEWTETVTLKVTQFGPYAAQVEGTQEIVDEDLKLELQTEQRDPEDNPVFSLNNDDDNDNGIADLDESQTSGTDDDLVPLRLTAPTEPKLGATVTLVADTSQVRIWQSLQKDQLLIGGSSGLMRWTSGSETIPPVVYVEGVSGSLALGDVLFVLQASDQFAVAKPTTATTTTADVNATEKFVQVTLGGQPVAGRHAGKVIVGKKVALEATFGPAAMFPNPVHKWETEGKTYADYISNENKGWAPPVVTNLAYTTLYWTDGSLEGIDRDVTYTLKSDAGEEAPRKTSFTVVRPEAKVETTTGHVELFKAFPNDPERLRDLGFIGGPPQGIHFERTQFKLPVGYTGKAYWVNVVDSSVRRERRPDGWYRRDGGGVDGSVPFKNRQDATGYEATTSDSPRILLDADRAVEAMGDDHFTMYLMFIADGEQTVPVVLRRVKWHWKGAAIWDGQKWTLAGDPDHSEEPEDEEWITQPEWTENNAAHELKKEQPE